MFLLLVLPIIASGEQCPPGQYLSDELGKCTSCPQINCEDCIEQGKYCRNCYQFVCQQCPDNCLSCYPGQLTCSECYCDLCRDGYQLSSGAGRCLPTCDGSCYSCTREGQCQCKIGFYEMGGICKSCPDYCPNCYWNQYQLQQECSDCAENEYKDQQFNCAPCDPYCKNCVYNFNYQKAYCTNCDNGRYLRDGYCDECSSYECMQNCEYDGSEVKCLCDKKTISNCNYCEFNYSSKQNECKECEIGYYLNSGVCQFCQPPCQTCSSEGLCLTCQQDGQYLDTGACKPCVYPCIQCVGPLITDCLSCVDGYYYSPKQSPKGCVPCQLPCKTCNGPLESNCVACSNGYFTTGNSCFTTSNKFLIMIFASILGIYLFQLIRQLCKYTQQRYTQIRN